MTDTQAVISNLIAVPGHGPGTAPIWSLLAEVAG